MRAILLAAVLGLLAACGRPDSGAPLTRDDAEAARYTCPMHPHYIATDPDGSCPICGMDLVPAEGARGAGDGSISVAPEMIQTIGVRTVPASITTLAPTIRAFGTVRANERRETVATSRVEGWIEELSVRAEGDSVDPGTVLYSIYSPDLIAAQKDYVSALELGSPGRTEAGRQRLVSLGMQPETIAALTRSREVIDHVPVLAENGGTVARLSVREGDYLGPGAHVLTLQSYDDVWIIADIPESDLSLVQAGLPVRLAFDSAPGMVDEALVDYVYPTIDAATRTGRIRIVSGNPAGLLRPGAYVDISIRTEGTTVLAVPGEAILRDSRGAHVILALGEGRFASRAVETGLSAEGMTAILAGLDEGETVVASGQFLLDSEVKLREGFAGLGSVKADADTPLGQIPLGPSSLAGIDHLPDMALYLHEALVDQYAVAPGFIDPVLALTNNLRLQYGGTRLGPVLVRSADAMRDAQAAREGERLAQALADLMAAIGPWLTEGAPQHYAAEGLVLYRDDEGRTWLQEGGEPRNPYGTGASVVVPWPAAPGGR